MDTLPAVIVAVVLAVAVLAVIARFIRRPDPVDRELRALIRKEGRTR